jgi:NDP-sugar pyrophosphorylase family protein
MYPERVRRIIPTRTPPTAPADAPDPESGGPIHVENRLDCRVARTSSPPVACILAGGLGTRLRPLTDDTPKPMVPVEGRPFLWYQLARLAEGGVTDFVLAVGYKAAVIEDYFGDGGAFGWDIRYVHERAPLGTGGAVANALPLLPERFLVLNGDTYLGLSWAPFLADEWEEQGFDGVIAVRPQEDCAAYGRVDHDGRRLLRFREKDASAGPGSINAGLYALRRSLFESRSGAFSMERDVLPHANLAVRAIDGDFIDIGTFGTLAAFRERMRGVTAHGSAP